MNVKKSITKQLDRLNISNNNNISNLTKILSMTKYNIILNTNYNLNIEYLIKQLTIDHICKLCIDGYLNFILLDNKLELYNIEIIAILLYKMRHTDTIYYNFILFDR
jgi:hypothetical protein